ncbi:MAG TPA: hypothetical protein VJ722_05090 [Rhodanobacteraceae bacterium]|nr:hypothetical protein [Rhodanobacteraceae bacterium]
MNEHHPADEVTQRDLALAYSPGVAYACTAIQHDRHLAAKYMARANLVAMLIPCSPMR